MGTTESLTSYSMSTVRLCYMGWAAGSMVGLHFTLVFSCLWSAPLLGGNPKKMNKCSMESTDLCDATPNVNMFDRQPCT